MHNVSIIDTPQTSVIFHDLQLCCSRDLEPAFLSCHQNPLLPSRPVKCLLIALLLIALLHHALLHASRQMVCLSTLYLTTVFKPISPLDYKFLECREGPWFIDLIAYDVSEREIDVSGIRRMRTLNRSLLPLLFLRWMFKEDMARQQYTLIYYRVLAKTSM